MDIKEWIEKNKLNVNWISGKIFEIEGDKFLVIEPKNEKIFDDTLSLKIDDYESQAFLEKECRYVVFKFGEYWFYCEPDDVKLNLLVYIGNSIEQDIGPYPFLGLHGGFEICNGSRSYTDWCRKANFLKINTLGICERNTLGGALSFQLACKESGIKSILGETVDVKLGQKIYRVKLYVQNDKGWNNLLWINKIINVDRQYEHYVTQGELFEKNEGLICLLGSFSPIDEQLIKKYKYYFKDRVYFQFDLFEYSSNQKDKEHLISLKKYVNNFSNTLKPIMVQDAYYLENDHGYIKKKLNAIGKVTSEFNSQDQFFKSPYDTFLEWCDLFGEDDERMIKLWGECIDNLMVVCDSCNYNIKLGELHLPKYKMTERESSNYNDNKELFLSLIESGLYRVNENEISVYIDRVEKEVEVINKGGFIDYFLILWDIIEWCNRQGILTGVGRGSAGGSLVAYLLGITQIDPIKYDLLFERFLNEGRIGKSLPDIDTDFEGERRGEVKRYIEERYGIDNVCSIGTYSTFKVKMAIQDLSRVYGISPKTSRFITKRIDSSGEKWESLFKECCQKMTIKDFVQENYEMINDIPLIINQPRSQSIHAAGVIITPSSYNGKDMTIYDWMPVKMIDGMLVSEWEGPLLEIAGFLKEDILGISQLDKFSDIIKLMQENGKEKVNFEDIDYNDQDVLELFRKGLNQDLFHFGSIGLTGYSKDVKPDSFEELIAMISLYRPGVMESGGHIKYIKIKEGKQEPEYDFGLEHITKETNSLLIYQEQIMQATVDLGGFSLGEADGIRKAMGKKIVEKMAEYEQRFIEGAIERGCEMFEAKKIWDKLALFAGYGFNRCISGREKFYRVGLNKTGKSDFNPTIGEMYRIKNDYSYAKKYGKISLYKKYNSLGYGTNFSLNKDDLLVKNKIKDIRYEGRRDVYRITVCSGETIDVTVNHSFPTKKGKKKVYELSSDDHLYVNCGYIKRDTSYRFGKDGDNYPVKGCHKKAHYNMGRTKMGERGLHTRFEKIVSIDKIGEDDVYDVEMESPYHTFTTQNNIVTCNSHAAAYAMIGYICQWFKNYHPMEFWTVSLQYASDSEISGRIGEINKLDSYLKLESPDINESDANFKPDFETKTIYWSLGKIAFVGDAMVNAILEERKKSKFYSLEDFYKRIPKKIVNKRSLLHLILSGCFDKIHNISRVQDRMILIDQYYELINEERSDTFSDKNIWKKDFWILLQKQLSGSGILDFDEVVSRSNLKDAKAKYIPPSDMNLEENLDKRVVVGGVIKNIVRRVGKKAGAFANVSLESNGELFFATLWNDTWEEYKNQLKDDSKGKIAIISGRVRDDNWRKERVIHSEPDSEIQII